MKRYFFFVLLKLHNKSISDTCRLSRSLKNSRSTLMQPGNLKAKMQDSGG